MINVEIKKDHLGGIVGYKVSGHAGYDDYGQDIVCSAMSILSHTALVSLVEVCGIDKDQIDYEVREEVGYLDVNLPKEVNKKKYKKSQIVFKSFELGVKSIVEGYPKFVTLKYRRWKG